MTLVQNKKLAIALVYVAVAIMGLGFGYALRDDSGDRPATAAKPTALLVPRSVSLMTTDAVDLISDARVPHGTPAPANQSSTDPPGIRNEPADQENATDHDAAQLIPTLIAAPCGIERTAQRLPALALPGVTAAGVTNLDVTFLCRSRDIAGPSGVLASDVRGTGVRGSDVRSNGAARNRSRTGITMGALLSVSLPGLG